MKEDAGQTAPLDSPYVGLMPYEERHASLFFGRKADREKIIANLRATRLTVFYGPSGVGKSSVLRAGVIPHLRRRAQPAEDDGSPEFAVIYHRDWVNDPLGGLAESIEAGIREALPGEAFEPVPPSRDLAQLLAAWTERFGLELLIILDQFEEYFLYRASETGPGTFAEEFPKAVKRRGMPVRFLISLREDALSKLDRFKGEIPFLFDSRLQIGHLRDDDARSAIREPIFAFNREYLPPTPYDIEDELVEAVLNEVGDLKLKLGGAGQGVVADQPAQQEIEAPYLQLVMTRIWETVTKAGEHELREQNLKDLGGAEQIVREHLDAVMNGLPVPEQEVAATIFKYLVTPVGNKIAHAEKSLIKYGIEETKCTEDNVKNLLRRLEAGTHRILYPLKLRVGQDELEGYQIFHDALAPAILGWRTRYLIERDKRLAMEAAAVEQKRIEEEAAREKERVKNETAKERYRAQVIAVAMLITVLLTAGGTSLFFYLKYLRTGEALQTKQDIINLIDLMAALSSDDAEKQSEALKKIEQLKSQGADLSAVTPALEEVAARKSSSFAIQVNGALATNTSAANTTTAATPTPTPNVQLKPRVYIHIQSEGQREEARRLKAVLEKEKLYNVPGIELVSKAKLPRNELRYFRDDELEIARVIVKLLQQQKLDIGEPKRIKGFDNSPYIRPKHFELWFKAAEETPPYAQQR